MKIGPESKDPLQQENAQKCMEVAIESAQLAAFEAELRAALRPTPPPAGFIERVLAAAHADNPRAGQTTLHPTSRPASRSQAKILPFRPWRLALGTALAASLVAGTFASEAWHGRRERARKQALANQQFQTATRITDQALAHTRAQLERAGVFRGY